jgi:methylamine dehydrogenase accessory protein MauD
MTQQILIASSVLLWLGLGAAVVVLIGVIRQVGLLHERSAPLGAMITDRGPDIGDLSPTFEVKDQSGRALTVGRALQPDSLTLIMFTGPNCPICEKLLPILRSVAATEKAQLLFISDGDASDHARFLKQHDLKDIPYVVSSEIGMRFQVSKIPYGVLLDAEGFIRAKGLCNTREHIESLFETLRLGHYSLQNYLASGKAGRPPMVAQPNAQAQNAH